MKTLDAIAEAHPDNLISLSVHSMYYGDDVIKTVQSAFSEGRKKSPVFLLDENFWTSLHDRISDEGRAYNKQNSSSIYDAEQFEQVIDLSVQQMGIARKIWEREIALIREGKYKTLFAEGDGATFAGRVAEHIGMDVVYLDRDNKFRSELDNLNYPGTEEYDNHQRERENVWVQRINDGGLIIAGGEHLRGAYGLDKQLLNKGIALNVVEDFSKYDAQIAQIFQQNQRLQKQALDSYCEREGEVKIKLLTS
jgi:hypothetical protein